MLESYRYCKAAAAGNESRYWSFLRWSPERTQTHVGAHAITNARAHKHITHTRTCFRDAFAGLKGFVGKITEIFTSTRDLFHSQKHEADHFSPRFFSLIF